MCYYLNKDWRSKYLFYIIIWSFIMIILYPLFQLMIIHYFGYSSTSLIIIFYSRCSNIGSSHTPGICITGTSIKWVSYFVWNVSSLSSQCSRSDVVWVENCHFLCSNDKKNPCMESSWVNRQFFSNSAALAIFPLAFFWVPEQIVLKLLFIRRKVKRSIRGHLWLDQVQKTRVQMRRWTFLCHFTNLHYEIFHLLYLMKKDT